MVKCWSLVTGSHHSGFIYIWDFLKWIQNMQGKKDESVYVLHSLIIFHLQRINNPNHVERKPVDDLILAAASKGQSVSIFKPSPTPRGESGGSRMLCKRPRWQASSVSWTGREPQEVDRVPRGDSLWWEGARDTDGPAERERERERLLMVPCRERQSRHWVILVFYDPFSIWNQNWESLLISSLI